MLLNFYNDESCYDQLRSLLSITILVNDSEELFQETSIDKSHVIYMNLIVCFTSSV